MLLPDHLAALDVLTRTYEGTPHGHALVELRLQIERLRAVERAARTYCREPTNQRFREMAAATLITPPGSGLTE